MKGIDDLRPRYLDNRKADLLALAAALEQNDYPVILTLGHNMKGTGKSYGFEAIGHIGACLEAAAQTQSGDQIRREISALAEYLSQVKVTR